MTDIFDHGGNIFAIARSLGVSPRDILDFSASINPLGLARGVREAVIASFDMVLHYPDSDSTELRQTLAGIHGVDPEGIIIANGSTELIHLIPRMAGGGRGLVVAPAFSEYAKALSRAGMGVHYLKLSAENGFRFCPDELEKELAAGFDVMFLCNPGNPSGALIPQPLVGKILELCRGAGTLPVIDEAFIDFREEESVKHLVLSGGCGIVLRSMTKFFAVPGLRIGYAIASPEVVRRLESLRGPWSVNTPAQVAAVASLRDAEHVPRTICYVEEERAFLADELARIGGLRPYPSSANYLLVRIGGPCSAGELRKQLLKRFILVRDCSNFEGLDSGFFRVAVRKREENVRLLQALRDILD